jgi:hypothetical protein
MAFATVACEKPTPEPPTPPKPVDPIEKTSNVNNINQLRDILNTRAVKNTSYKFNVKQNIGVTMDDMHYVGDVKIFDAARDDVEVDFANFGIDFPSGTILGYTPWDTETKTHKIVANNQGVWPGSNGEADKFAAAGYPNIKDIEISATIDLTPENAARFSEYVSELSKQYSNGYLTLNLNHPVIMNDTTATQISTPLVPKPGARIMSKQELRINDMYITTGQYSIGDTLTRTDMHIKISEALGTKTRVLTHNPLMVDEFVDIVVGGVKGKNVVYDIQADGRYGYFILLSIDVLKMLPVEKPRFGLNIEKNSLVTNKSIESLMYLKPVATEERLDNYRTILLFLEESLVYGYSLSDLGLWLRYYTSQDMKNFPGLAPAGKEAIMPYVPQIKQGGR